MFTGINLLFVSFSIAKTSINLCISEKMNMICQILDTCITTKYSVLNFLNGQKN